MNALPLQELVLSVKGLPRLARFLPKVMLALLVSISAEGYKKLAIWLNDMGMLSAGRSLLPSPREEGPQPPQAPRAAPLLTPLTPRELPAGERLREAPHYQGCSGEWQPTGRARQDSWGRGSRVTTACFPQFQFINSYLSLFYIGFYLKDMERLKEVSRWLKAVPCPHGGQRGAGPGPRGPWALQPLPHPPSFSPLCPSVHLFVLSACHPPICLSACPSVPSQLLLVLSLSQSLERQLRAVLGPLVALQFHLLLLSLRGLLHLAQAKVWAGGEPEGLAGAGSVAVLGASQQAEGACYEGMGPPGVVQMAAPQGPGQWLSSQVVL